MVAGSGFALAVAVEDSFGNVAAGFAGSVTAGAGQQPGESLPRGHVDSDCQPGVASFAGLALNVASAGTNAAGDRPAGWIGNDQRDSVTPAAAAQLVISSQPPGSVMLARHSAFMSRPTDAYGNLATAFAGSVALDLEDNSGGGDVSGSVTATAVMGVADFANVSWTMPASATPWEPRAMALGRHDRPVRQSSPRGAQLVTTPAPAGTVDAGSGFGLTVWPRMLVREPRAFAFRAT